ncbi:hypothetical protein XENTR_v10008538 [Xenopus tropicalis]|nr:hypothetical protein XENTR_v10008538 [Xenopus tropicalis]
MYQLILGYCFLCDMAACKLHVICNFMPPRLSLANCLKNSDRITYTLSDDLSHQFQFTMETYGAPVSGIQGFLYAETTAH